MSATFVQSKPASSSGIATAGLTAIREKAATLYLPRKMSLLNSSPEP
jgi:hypothetical protein